MYIPLIRGRRYERRQVKARERSRSMLYHNTHTYIHPFTSVSSLPQHRKLTGVVVSCGFRDIIVPMAGDGIVVRFRELAVPKGYTSSSSSSSSSRQRLLARSSPQHHVPLRRHDTNCCYIPQLQAARQADDRVRTTTRNTTEVNGGVAVLLLY